MADDIKVQVQRAAEQHLLESNIASRSVTPLQADGFPLGWEVKSVNTVEEVVADPEQGMTLRRVVVVSTTYVNTTTGETRTVPIVPGG